MRHYEVVFLVHPDQSEQVPAMMQRYRGMIEGAGGTVHREEDWGRRQLAHSISKVHKAHYALFNIECERAALDELVGAFRFSDAVLRHLVIRRDKPVSEPSVMAQAYAEEKARDAQSAERERRPRPEAASRAEAAPQAKATSEAGATPEAKPDDEPKAEGTPESKPDDEPKAEGTPEAKADDEPKAEGTPEAKADDEPKAEGTPEAKADDEPKAEGTPEVQGG